MYSTKTSKDFIKSVKSGKVVFDSQGTFGEPVLEKMPLTPCNYPQTFAALLLSVQPIDLKGEK